MLLVLLCVSSWYKNIHWVCKFLLISVNVDDVSLRLCKLYVLKIKNNKQAYKKDQLHQLSENVL